MESKQIESVRKRLAGEIDTGWHSSWHWDKDQYGYVTPKGWREALKDAERNAQSARKDADRREAFLIELREAVAQVTADEDEE